LEKLNFQLKKENKNRDCLGQYYFSMIRITTIKMNGRNKVVLLLVLVLFYTITYSYTATLAWYAPYILNFGIFALGTAALLSFGGMPEMVKSVLDLVKLSRSDMEPRHWVYFIAFLFVVIILYPYFPKLFF